MRFFRFIFTEIFIKFHFEYFRLIYRILVLLSHQFGMAVMLRSLFTPLFGSPGFLSRVNGFVIRFLALILGGVIIGTLVFLSLIFYSFVFAFPIYLLLNYPYYFVAFIFLVFIIYAFQFVYGIPYKIVDKSNIREYLLAGDYQTRNLLQNLLNSQNDKFIKVVKSSKNIDLFAIRAEIPRDYLDKFLAESQSNFDSQLFSKNLLDLGQKLNIEKITIELLLVAYLLSQNNLDKFLQKINLDSKNLIDTLAFVIFLKKMPTNVWDEEYTLPPAGGIDKAWAVGYSPTINKYGTDLTALALKGSMPTIYGRSNTRHEVINILSKNSRNNVLLIGASGAGKTTFVKAFARQVALGTKIPKLMFKRIIALDVGGILSGDLGEVTNKINKILKEAESSGNIILFIDEIHTIDSSIFNLIEPYLSSGKFQFIATTSASNYAKYIQPIDSFARTFDIVQLPETNIEDTILIMQDQIKKIETEHRNILVVTFPAILSAIEMAKKYVHNRAFPDKSVELLNQAFARGLNMKSSVLDRNSIIELISEVLGLPIKKLDDSEKSILTNLENLLKSKIISQDLAVEAISKSLKRARAGVKDDNKPMGSFLFAGPTGVGKTETAKVLAELYFGSVDSMIRIDMSEYQTKESIGRLIGSDSGEIGQLVYKVQSKPYALVLLDEIEKAHPSILNVFLQVLDEGFLTSASGDKTYFSNTFIIMTSNVGTKELMQKLSDDNNLDVTEVVINSLKHHFPPEFLNRFTGLIPFMPLSEDSVLSIVRLKLDNLSKKMKNTKQIEITFSDESIQQLAGLGLSKDWGARSINRVIEDKVETVIAEKIIRGELKSGDKYFFEKINAN